MQTTTGWRQALPWLNDRGLCLLPIGAKPPERKAPVDPDTGYGLRNWQHSTGYTVADLAAMNPAHVIAVGINTGHGGILVVDIDGASAAEWIKARGLDPRNAGTWTVARNTDPDRYKLVFRLTPEQQALFPQTKLLLRTVKGEALEIYYQPGAQVLVLGEHCKSGGNYTWGGTPADIATPSAQWMDIFTAIAEAVAALRGKGDTSKPPRIKGISTSGATWTASGHGRPCPICARQRSAACTWSLASDGRRIATCFHGSADHTPPSGLKQGGVITGRDGNQWAFVRDYFAECLGEKSLFIEHRPMEARQQQPPEPWQPPNPQPTPQPQPTTSTAAARLNLTPQDAIDDECHRIHCLPSNDPTRHTAINALLRAAADLIEATQDGETLLPDLVTQITDLGIGRREAKKVIKDRRLEIQRERREAVKLQRLDAVRQRAAAAPDPILQIVGTLPAAPDEKINAGKLVRALRPSVAAAGLQVRFNLLTRAVELNGIEIPEHTVELAHTRFQEADWAVGKNDAIDAILSLARESSYHPVAEYLDRIEHDNAIPYFDLDAIATNFLGTTDPLYDRMMKVALVGAVRRIRKPACQHDTVVVFQGKQGARKTRFWKALASDDWYSPCTTGREVEMLMVMHRAWIVEFGELEGITGRHEISALRTLITTSADPFRVPYGRSVAMHKRHFLLVGTVNPAGFLNDPEGHRRFHCIPIPQGHLIDVDRVRELRDSIWKAAALAYAGGAVSFLCDQDQEESNRRNTVDHVMESAWDGPITAWAEQQVHGMPFTVAQVLVGSEVREKGHIQPADYGRVVQILKTLGWTRHPVVSRRAWVRS